MKKLFFALLILTSQNILSQDFPINEKTGEVSFGKIIQAENVSKSDLYIRANEWFAKTFNSSQSVIQMQDKEAGKIIGKGNITAYGHYGKNESGIWNFTISFRAKEGRFQYSITDIYHDKGLAVSGSGGNIKNVKPECGKWLLTNKQWNKIKARAYVDFTNISKDFEETMTRVISEDDDW